MPPTIAPPPKAPADPKPATPETLASSANDHDPNNYMGDIGSSLAELDAADGVPPKPETAKQRSPDGKFTKPQDAPKKPQEEPKEEEAPESPPEPEKPKEEAKPSNIRALGKAYDELKKERDTVYKPKLQSLEAKTREYEKTIEDLRKGAPDLKPVQERMSALEKENQQLREVVRFADYRKSPEFTEKYEKPYNEAWNKAVSEVTQLTLQMEDGAVRKATTNDLLALANAPLDQLDDLASQWFPKSSPRVIRHVEKIKDLADAQDKALEEAKKGAGEFQTKRTLEQQQNDAKVAKAYQDVNTQLVEKYPKIFGTDETDPQGNELLKKGLEYADTVFMPNSNISAEQRASRLAVLRMKAANHDRLFARGKDKDKRIAELEAKLSEYEKSEPPTEDAGEPGTVSNGNWFDPIEAEIRKMDRR